MPSFGEKLRREREKRALTLEQISTTTKIGTRMLQALEEDKFNQLPGGIFNKGFVRAYARCVGLDEDQTVADYLEASGDISPIKFQPGTEIQASLAPEEEEHTGNHTRRDLPWGLLAAALLLLALILTLWSYRNRERRESVSLPAKSAVATPETQPVATAPPAAQTSKELSDSAQSKSVAQKIAPPTSPVATAPIRPAHPGEFTVLIQAREDSWISVATDGETTVSATLPAGTQRLIHASKEVVVRVGNAGGVDFSFNGKQLKPQGTSGEAKTLAFGPTGLQPSHLATPATPQ